MLHRWSYTSSFLKTHDLVPSVSYLLNFYRQPGVETTPGVAWLSLDLSPMASGHGVFAVETYERKEAMWTLSVHRLEDGTRAQCHPFAQLALLVNLHPGFAVCYLHLGCSRSKRGQCFLA